MSIRASLVCVLCILCYALPCLAGVAYSESVQSSVPVGYWRFGAGSAFLNTGTRGPLGDLTPSGEGLSATDGPSTRGFETGNSALAFDAPQSRAVSQRFIQLDNPFTVSCWIYVDELNSDETELITLSDGTNAFAVTLQQRDGIEVSCAWRTKVLAQAWRSYLPVPQGLWCYVAVTVTREGSVVYLGDASSSISFQASTNATGLTTFKGPVSIAVGSSQGASASAALDELAVFDRELGIGEIYTQFAEGSDSLAPLVFNEASGEARVIYEGEKLHLSVEAGGASPLLIAWRKDGLLLPGATSSTWGKEEATLSDGGKYDVVVTSGGIRATSAVMNVTVRAQFRPAILRQPANRLVYPGGVVKLDAQAGGGALRYFWRQNNVPIPGATNSALLIENAQLSNAGMYSLIASNNLGSITSSPVAVQILEVKTGSYEATVLNSGPRSWWRLNELGAAEAFLDSMGRNDGYWTNSAGRPVLDSTLGVAGDLAASFGKSGTYGVVPAPPELSGGDFTLVAWVRTDVLTGAPSVPVSSSRDAEGFWFWTYPRGNWSGGAFGGDTTYYMPSQADGAVIRPGTWTMLALTYSPATSLRFHVNGQWDSQGYVDFRLKTGAPLVLGARGTGTGYAADMCFTGVLDEVALYGRAVTAEELRRQYVAALYGVSTAPVFLEQPVSTDVKLGEQAVFRASVEGTEPLSFQWFRGEVAIAGATNATLSLPSESYRNAGIYKLIASNSAGASVSAPASLIIRPPVTFANVTNDLVLHLNFERTFSDASGRGNDGQGAGPVMFTNGIVGNSAFAYRTDTTNSVFSHASIARTADLEFGPTTSFSIALWIRMTPGFGSGDLPILANSYNSFGNRGITVAPSYNENGWSWSLSDGTNSASASSAAGVLKDDAWHHFVLVCDRDAQVATTYWDGQEVRSDALPSLGSLDAGGSLHIGQDASGMYSESGGATIDDLGIWRRRLLGSEVAAVHAAGRFLGKSFDTYGPVKLLIFPSDNQLLFVWEAGTLLQSESPHGPWRPVEGASSPNHRVPASAGNGYFKVSL